MVMTWSAPATARRFATSLRVYCQHIMQGIIVAEWTVNGIGWDASVVGEIFPSARRVEGCVADLRAVNPLKDMPEERSRCSRMD